MISVSFIEARASGFFTDVQEHARGPAGVPRLNTADERQQERRTARNSESEHDQRGTARPSGSPPWRGSRIARRGLLRRWRQAERTCVTRLADAADAADRIGRSGRRRRSTSGSKWRVDIMTVRPCALRRRIQPWIQVDQRAAPQRTGEHHDHRDRRGAGVIVLLELGDDQQRRDLGLAIGMLPEMKITEPYSPTAAREG